MSIIWTHLFNISEHKLLKHSSLSQEFLPQDVDNELTSANKKKQVVVAQCDERPTRDQKDTGSLLRLGTRFLAYIQKTVLQYKKK